MCPKPDLTRYAPPGFPLRTERQLFLLAMIVAVLFSLQFPARYAAALQTVRQQLERNLPAIMPDFYQLLGRALLGFALPALCMLIYVFLHYSYHHQGSRSIYLMRRLPDPTELHRRCLTLPLLGIACCILTAAVVLMLYFAIYMTVTPKPCLMPQQWQKLWSVLL